MDELALLDALGADGDDDLGISVGPALEAVGPTGGDPELEGLLALAAAPPPERLQQRSEKLCSHMTKRSCEVRLQRKAKILEDKIEALALRLDVAEREADKEFRKMEEMDARDAKLEEQNSALSVLKFKLQGLLDSANEKIAKLETGQKELALKLQDMEASPPL